LEDWVAALRRLWNDREEYQRVSEAALTFSQRPELDPERQFATFFALLDRAARQRARRAA
ncbi:MAG: glycosyl transferase family 1, partial [Mesorhizobium sp.]